MLTLAGAMRLGRFTVYRDIEPATGAYTARFFLLPDAPQVARDATGMPEFDFLWYRGPAGTARAGGLVTLTVELGASDAERGDLVRAVRAALPSETLADLELLTVPFLDGTVELSLAGSVVATAPARLQGVQRATFVVELGAEDAGLVHTLLATGADLFAARYDLRYAHRLTGVDLRVWCDGRRAHEVSAQLGTGDGGRVRDALVVERAAGVELVTEQILTPEHRARLETLGASLLSSALTSSLKSPYAPGVEASLNHTFAASTLLPQHAVAATVIRLGATLTELGERVRVVDLRDGFFASLDVAVLCTVDFDRELIDVVRVVVTYDGDGPGGRVTRSADLLFRAGVGPLRFRTDLAAPDQLAVSWRVEVHYRGDPQPVVIEHPPVATTAIVLDLDGTGVLEVSAAVRDTSWTGVSAAILELEHPATGHTARLVLDAARPTDTWTAVVRTTPGPVRYRVTWRRASGTDLAEPALVEEWVTTSSRTLTLDPPLSLTARTSVELVAVGDFSGLAQLLVELRTAPDAPVAVFGFTAAGEGASWSDPGLDPAALAYQSRQVLTYADGRRDEFGWADRDAPVLVVGDLLRFDVLVEPRLLDLGATYRLALVEFAPGAGSADPVVDTTLALRDRTLPQHWSFRMTAPGVSNYRYRLTLVPPTGPRQVGSWTESRSSILVLRAADPSPSTVLSSSKGSAHMTTSPSTSSGHILTARSIPE